MKTSEFYITSYTDKYGRFVPTYVKMPKPLLFPLPPPNGAKCTIKLPTLSVMSQLNTSNMQMIALQEGLHAVAAKTQCSTRRKS
eukprot:15366804-Ditylum_brightwellii.AAC.1